jgi:hypothetical protein
MKDLGKFKLFGLLIFLSLVLVFAGVNFLEGKKPGNKPPKWDWKVGIPEKYFVSDNPDLSLNVYGNSPVMSGGYAVFEKNDFVQMGVQRTEHRETGDIIYHIYLRVYNNNEGYSIGFNNLAFVGCQIGSGCENPWCCVFPPAELPGEVPCSELNCSGIGSTGYECMEDFLEGYDHPSWGYEVIAIRMYIFCDIEAIPAGHSVTADGQMWQFDVWNTSAPLINGNEEYHNIVCKYLHYDYDEGVKNLEDVEIHRSDDGNTWTVIVNQDGSASSYPDLDYKLLGFRESYQKGVYKEKGKSGKYVLDSKTCTALAARTVFKFESRLTRY